jgi:hypothetical protein
MIDETHGNNETVMHVKAGAMLAKWKVYSSIPGLRENIIG